jgi:hypothetical protein
LDIPGVGEDEKPRHQATKGPSLFSYRWREGEKFILPAPSHYPGGQQPSTDTPGWEPTLVDPFGLHLGLGYDPSPYLEYLCGGAGDITTGRGLWRFWDWTLDRFMVGKHFLMDWDKKPLWFGEEKKQTELENVQSVSVEKKGVFSLFFNFGNVKILTAGEDMNLVFENVPNPEIIQHEIFFRRSQRNREILSK